MAAAITGRWMALLVGGKGAVQHLALRQPDRHVAWIIWIVHVDQFDDRATQMERHVAGECHHIRFFMTLLRLKLFDRP